MTRPLRIAALLKQVPRIDQLRLGTDGRLLREGLALEMNPYCRRAVSKGVELARQSGGSCTALTLGPPPAEAVLREAVAWGATEGVLLSDAAFAGSDTLATAKALAALLELEGPFDLVLVGRNSVDSDTGQVGPQLAELLDLPFVGPVRTLDWPAGRSESNSVQLAVCCESDDGRVEGTVLLPAVVSVAERLCEPAKAPPEQCAQVAPDRIRRRDAGDLGPGPWGQAASPTRVGEIRTLDVTRDQRRLSGSIDRQVDTAVALLLARGALDQDPPDGRVEGRVPEAASFRRTAIGVVIEPRRSGVGAELLGRAAQLASELDGRVTAISAGSDNVEELGCWGADDTVVVEGSDVEEDVAAAVAVWASQAQPQIVLAPSTTWGRQVAARVAAQLGAGLTGDAVELEVHDGRLTAWKPAFGGAVVAAITSTSPIEMATVRPGMLAPLAPRHYRAPVARVSVETRDRVQILKRYRDDDLETLARASAVIGVGTGVAPDRYPELDDLRCLLCAELAATRKVTDRGWMPRARQIGITGRSIAPRLYLALGLSGKFNHMVGVRRAGTVLAVNNDPDAPVFSACDIGIIGDWIEVVPYLTKALRRVTHDEQQPPYPIAPLAPMTPLNTRAANPYPQSEARDLP